MHLKEEGEVKGENKSSSWKGLIGKKSLTFQGGQKIPPKPTAGLQSRGWTPSGSWKITGRAGHPLLQAQWELHSQTPSFSSSALFKAPGMIIPHSVHQLPKKFPKTVVSIHVVSSPSKRGSGTKPSVPVGELRSPRSSSAG